MANGYERCEVVDAATCTRLEPHLGPGALGGLTVPDESLVCPWTPPIAFATEAVANGADLRRGCALVGAEPAADGWALSTTTGPLHAAWVVNAAGLRGDDVEHLLGHDGFTVTPRRGELIVFDKLARPLVRHILLPVPTGRTKGVLVSPTVFGNVVLGPTAEDLDDKTDTASTASGIASLLDHGRRILPALLDEEVTAVYAGLRAATERVRLPAGVPRRGPDRLPRRHPLDGAHRVDGPRRVDGRRPRGGRPRRGGTGRRRRRDRPEPRRGVSAPLPAGRPHRCRPRVRRDRLPLRTRDRG